MADLRDEFGNPIQLTDEQGNPVQLTDEFGNPMHLTGVAVPGGAGAKVVSAETKVETTLAGPPAAVYGGGAAGPAIGAGVVGAGAVGTAHHGVGGVAEGERKHETLEQKLERSSSSSSSEDDGQGGRRKKKGIKEKIKEKLSGKHKDKEEHAPYPTTVTSEIRPGEHHTQQEHEKKSMMEKIKEKLPGHH